jgi:hypothetical protein
LAFDIQSFTDRVEKACDMALAEGAVNGITD